MRLNLARLAGITERVRDEVADARARDLRARRGGVHDRLAAAAGRDPVREARPVAQAPRQDRLLHRRARAAGDPHRARDHRRGSSAGASSSRWPRPTSTCCPSMVDERLAHPHHLPAGRWRRPGACPAPTRTCRTSRSAPPLGREIRGCFEAEEGNVLISADYSQIELRVLAHVADEPVLKEIFAAARTCTPRPPRRCSASRPTTIDPGMRSKAKMINYGIVYGLSDFGLADRLNIPREEAKEFIDAYLERFPRVAEFMAETIEQAKRAGLRDDAVGAPAPDPRAARAQLPGAHAGRAPGRQHRDPGHAPPTSSSSRWCAAHGALGRRRAGDAADPHDPRRAAVRRARPRRRRRRASWSSARWCGVWEHDPPLAVDVGVGQNWLEASEARAGSRSRSARRAPGCWSACRRRSTRAWARAVGTLQAATFSFVVGTVVAAC